MIAGVNREGREGAFSQLPWTARVPVTWLTQTRPAPAWTAYRLPAFSFSTLTLLQPGRVHRPESTDVTEGQTRLDEPVNATRPRSVIVIRIHPTTSLTFLEGILRVELSCKKSEKVDGRIGENL